MWLLCTSTARERYNFDNYEKTLSSAHLSQPETSRFRHLCRIFSLGTSSNKEFHKFDNFGKMWFLCTLASRKHNNFDNFGKVSSAVPQHLILNNGGSATCPSRGFKWTQGKVPKTQCDGEKEGAKKVGQCPAGLCRMMSKATLLSKMDPNTVKKSSKGDWPNGMATGGADNTYLTR